MDKLRIALDWDGTVTADRELWFAFIKHAKERGHDIFIATARSEETAQKVREEVAQFGIKVIAVDGKPKINEVDRQTGHFPDIWIDDMPHLLFCSSKE